MTKRAWAAIMVILFGILLGSGCAFAGNAFEDDLARKEFLYDKDFVSAIERADNQDWMRFNHFPEEFSGELGYAVADLDRDGENELLTVGICGKDELDEYRQIKYHQFQLRIEILEQDADTPHSYLLPIYMGFASLTSSWADPSEDAISALLRVYLFGEEPYIMVETYDCENFRGDGAEYQYLIMKYDGSALRIAAENGYEGSNYPAFETEHVIELARHGIGCVDFYAAHGGDGIIQTVEAYTPVAGVITCTLVNFNEYDSWVETGDGHSLDVSEAHVFSREELKAGALKKLWDGGNANPDPLTDWVRPNGYIEAEGDSNIRSLPSLDGKIVGLLKNGEQAEYLNVTMEDERGVNWYCVLVNNTYGWVSEKYTVAYFDEYLCTQVSWQQEEETEEIEEEAPIA